MTNLSGTNLNSGVAAGPKSEGRDSPSKYQPYPEYKDSGVKWLGEIPRHWDTKRLKYVCRLITKKIRIDGQNVIALENIEGFTGKFIETGQCYSGEDVAFEGGDILFGKLRPYLAKVFLAKGSGVAFGDLLVYRPGKDVLPEYAFGQMISDGFITEVDSSTYGSKMPRANVEFINNMAFLIPKKEEQTQIATFLDRETQKIDRLIEKQQQLINLLQEKRQAVISHAVTKGLNPNVKMKDSGVEWLGEIPEHWSVKRLKYISDINPDVLPENTCGEYEFEYVDIGSVSFGLGIQKTERMRFSSAPSRARRLVRNGDVIISTVRTYLRAISPIKEEKVRSIYRVLRGKAY